MPRQGNWSKSVTHPRRIGSRITDNYDSVSGQNGHRVPRFGSRRCNRIEFFCELQTKVFHGPAVLFSSIQYDVVGKCRTPKFCQQLWISLLEIVLCCKDPRLLNCRIRVAHGHLIIGQGTVGIEPVLTEKRIREIFREELRHARVLGDDPFLNMPEATEFLNISESKLRRCIRDGEIIPHRLGGRVLFRRSSLEAAVSQ